MKIEIWHVINIDNQNGGIAYVLSFLTEEEAKSYCKEQSELPYSQRPDYSYIQMGEIELPFRISEMD